MNAIDYDYNAKEFQFQALGGGVHCLPILGRFD